MANQYDEELERLTETYRTAIVADVAELKIAFSGASESSVIAVGSGGSYTVASLICGFHETYTGRVSRASTPLEIICNPNLAASSPVFFVSAEGKNPDVIEALDRARHHSSRQIHILTNRETSRLVAHSAALTNISVHSFNLEKKDGYLATNSLLLDAIVVGRAYAELDGNTHCFPTSLEELYLSNGSLPDWNTRANEFAQTIPRRGGLIILHSPFMRPVATDLESKLSESALLYSQVVDFRSFAHGRHLWLAMREDECAIVALVDPSVHQLWEATKKLLPPSTSVLTIEIDSSAPAGLLASLSQVLSVIPKSAEICPVLPHPSRDPRRGDRLILEYKEALFDARLTPTSNILYAHEANPFEAYRQLVTAMDRYRESMSIMGGCRLVVTPLGSKLMTVAAGLACYAMRPQTYGADFSVGMPYSEGQRYQATLEALAASKAEISAILLTGEAYTL